MATTTFPLLDVDPAWRMHPSQLSIVKAVGRRLLPYLIEATLIPAALFYAFLIAFDLGWAIAAVAVWTYAAIGRRILTGRSVPGLLVLATVGISVRIAIFLFNGNEFVFFFQPIMRTVATAACFALSAVCGRPLIARFATDFCRLGPDVLDRPAVVRLFRRLTFLWAGVNATAAMVSLTLLLTAPIAVFVGASAFANWILTCGGVVLTVSGAARLARTEGLQTAVAPNGRLRAYVASVPDEAPPRRPTCLEPALNALGSIACDGGPIGRSSPHRLRIRRPM